MATNSSLLKIAELVEESKRRVTEVAKLDPRFMFRKFQRNFADMLCYYSLGERISNPHGALVTEIVPGGGKSCMSALGASCMIGSGIVKQALWIVPRRTLVRQARDEFYPWPKRIDSKTLSDARKAAFNPADVRSRTVKGDCPIALGRDKDGTPITVAIASYQAISKNQKAFLDWVQERPTFVIIDEGQMLQEDVNPKKKGTSWFSSVEPIASSALLGWPDSWLLFQSGGLSRYDKKPIPFVSFVRGDPERKQSPSAMYPHAHITYSFSEGQVEQSHLKLDFDLYEGDVAFRLDNARHDYFLSTIESDDACYGKALLTFLHNEKVRNAILDSMYTDYTHYKKQTGYKTCAYLVIADSIKQAKLHCAHLESKGAKPLLITSDDEKSAQLLEEFRTAEPGKRKGDGIVTVAMAQIGINIQPFSHMAYLSNIRSLEWILQAIHRITRTDYNTSVPQDEQVARVHAPNDPKFVEIRAQIINMQSKAKRELSGRNGNGAHSKPGGADISFEMIDANVYERQFQTNNRPVGDSAVLNKVLTDCPALNRLSREDAWDVVRSVLANSNSAPGTLPSNETANKHEDEVPQYVHVEDVVESKHRDVETLRRELAMARFKEKNQDEETKPSSEHYAAVGREIYDKFGVWTGKDKGTNDPIKLDEIASYLRDELGKIKTSKKVI